MTQAMLRPLPERAPAPALDHAPPTILGKFFFVGERKLYLRGVSYGPFATSLHGFPFPDQETVERDLTLMAALGANCLRTFTVPPRWLLDRAVKGFFAPPRRGAEAPVRLATAVELENVNGRYFDLMVEKPYSRNALDDDLMEALYEFSVKKAGLEASQLF